MDLPLTWSISRLLSFKPIIYYDTTSTCRLGLINRDTLNIKWFVLREKTVIFHFVNSWEEDNKLYIYAICYDYRSFDIYNLDKQQAILKLFKVDLLEDPDTFIVDSSIVSYTPCEFPSLHSDNIGRHTEHFYYLKIGLHGFDGIIKYNTITKKEVILKLKDGYTCGEVSVMDNDRLITYVYNSVDKLSAIHVYDGETMNEIPILVIPLTHRIPIGFHGQFIKYNLDNRLDNHLDNHLDVM
jgi:carotenoid cleavage dioxygenase-like enzyme